MFLVNVGSSGASNEAKNEEANHLNGVIAKEETAQEDPEEIMDQPDEKSVQEESKDDDDEVQEQKDKSEEDVMDQSEEPKDKVSNNHQKSPENPENPEPGTSGNHSIDK